MSDDRIVHGATSEWSTDGTTYAKIPKSRNLVVPEVQVDYQDATSLDSPDGFREYVPGLKDAGEITIPCGYTPATYGQAHGYRASAQVIYFRTTLPTYDGQTSGDVFTFKGFVSPQLETNEAGQIVMMNLNVRTSGDVQYTAGATS